ncbi:germ cell nuclear acidic protein [Lampris incognitus]|uniref:germ cell nuclear acidic protein n=1 Tax=Lampris incognitus TaxID=2546036 RepID=UPI0024B503DB|nr:germ cell nuclear acidic protein [Lampris incognitus]
MDSDTHIRFQRIADKLGWTKNGGLDTAETNVRFALDVKLFMILIKSIGKSRHPAASHHGSTGAMDSACRVRLHLSDSEYDADKENQSSRANDYRDKASLECSEDNFEGFFVNKVTPKTKDTSWKPCSSAKKDSSCAVVSSDSDGSFEIFLNKIKTPKEKPKTTPENSEDSLKNFIVDDLSSDDDFIEQKPLSRVPKSIRTPATKPHARRQVVSQCDSSVFISDSDDDDYIVKTTWRTRHSRPNIPQKANKGNTQHSDQEDNSFKTPSPSLAPHLVPTASSAPQKYTCSGPSKLDASASSEEEMSLLDRLKKKKKVYGSSSTPVPNIDCTIKPPVSVPAVKTQPIQKPRSLGQTPLHIRTPKNSTISRPMTSQTEPRHGHSSRVVICKTPDCFLESLSTPGSSYESSFKKNKEDLTSRLYNLYNTSVFDSKLPTSMSVTWNKKMRKTAGYCVTGQERGRGSRYARIELSEKVCDSAERLRDTLIHEMCHAATWLVNGERDGHGTFWKLYAHKATLAHPELPMVTRCHTYDIKYKYQYECSRCKNTIGRHSKSLDTERFMCAFCTGRFVLLTPSKPRAPTPFAIFVKENYGSTRQELVGQSHADVMRKLSADFTTKTKLSQS